MSNKTAKKRSTKSAIKALRRKRHNKNRANYENGGRVGKFYGGPLRTDIDVNPEDYKDYAPPPQEEDKIVESQPLPEPDPTTGPDPESGGVVGPDAPSTYTAPRPEVVKAGEIVETDYAGMADLANQNPAMQHFGYKVSYDPETNRFVRDNSALGFTGDSQYTYFTPEEFASEYDIDMSQYQTRTMDPSLTTQEGDIQQIGPQDQVTAGEVTAQDLTAETATAGTAQMPEEPVTAETYTAVTAGEVGPTQAAQLTDLDPRALASVTEQTKLTQEAEAKEATQEEIKAAYGEAATRPDAKDYATAATTDKTYTVADVEGPGVTTREGITIGEEEKQELLSLVTGEGVNLEDLPEYELAAKRTAQVGTAKTGIAQQLGEAPSVDFEGREAILGEAPQGDASQIGGVPTMAASSMQAVTGGARKAAAADMMAVVGKIPPEVTAAVSEDPATVEAQLDTGEDPTVTAAVAALPPEALVSVQMENLLAGMEEGQTPAWARPAVAAIEQQMAQRGMTASTVGRDALFNAIIQSALPIAQSNAQALQQRAAQNLSNEQQANLASAQNTMQIRMQNLANRQTAASQTADMAQQIKVQQGQFRQQAKMVTADQQQQVRMQNIQNAQQRASQESAQRQQTALANLDSGTRIDLANLEAMNMAGRENLNADQQAKLATYQSRVNRIMRQAELEQDMTKANLDASLRMEMMNLTEQNAAARDTMTAENQERLTNLQTLVDFKKTNAQLAQQMDLANLNNEQQMELANLAERAAADSANMTEANRFRLQELTTYTNVMSQNAELRQRAEMARLSAAEKVSLANLTAKNQADADNMNANNTAELQQYEKKMQAAQLNAQLAQQMGLANLSNQQEAAMFNAQIDANMDMKQFDANQQMALANSQFMQSMTMKNLDNRQQAAMQNATAMANLDLANVDQRTRLAVQNAQAFLEMDMANLNNQQQSIMLDQQMKQQRMLSDQAAQNAAAQFNATSENQTNQFMASMEAQMNQFNTSQANAMAQFNTSEQNRMAAINAGNQLEADRYNAQATLQAQQFNAQMDYQVEQWNAANAQAIEQSNVAWRRQANLADTAAQNAANQQQAQFQFNMDAQSQSQMWQQMRDQAAFNFQAEQSERDRLINVINSALSNEAFMTDKNMAGQRSQLFNMLNTVTGGAGSFITGQTYTGSGRGAGSYTAVPYYGG